MWMLLHLGLVYYIMKTSANQIIILKMHGVHPLLHTMLSNEYWACYHEQLDALDLMCHPTSFILWDWALNIANIASEWVEEQFAMHVTSVLLLKGLI
jgi:hypothetical protein